MDSVSAWFKWLHQTSGIKLTIFYDRYDRSRFLEGLSTTLELSAIVIVLSLFFWRDCCLAVWNEVSMAAPLCRCLRATVSKHTTARSNLFFLFCDRATLAEGGGRAAVGLHGLGDCRTDFA